MVEKAMGSGKGNGIPASRDFAALSEESRRLKV